jgi:serine-type D-Ala-D-Ala carboxypeptidase (penicillin-binding protein 5/6)
MRARVSYYSSARRGIGMPRKIFLCGLLSFLFTVSMPVANGLAAKANSRAAVAIDASTGEILFSKNPNRRLPPASTTKLMTAIVALENVPLSKVVTISRNASRVEHFKAGFKEGDRITVEGLLYTALIRSANDAAFALAEAAAGSESQFAQLMNQKAISIGAEDTRFINSTGLPGPGQYTTALDLSKILNCAMGYPKLREIIGISETQVATEDGKTFNLRNTDKLLWSDDKVIGGKTGYTRSARHCFVVAARDDKKTVIVALLGSPTRRSLWRETEALIMKALHRHTA